jgi:hypothetical protein
MIGTANGGTSDPCEPEPAGSLGQRTAGFGPRFNGGLADLVAS